MQKTTMPKLTPVLLTVFLVLFIFTLACDKKPDETKKPNILLIIGDDFGMDVTSDMNPGLIENLEKKYGPSGYNHPEYKSIRLQQTT